MMKYLYWDLGEQEQESAVVVHHRGSAANVILLDPVNFDRYRYGLSFHYTGGLYTRSPARLEIPKDGHWYLAIDCCGYQHHVEVRKIQILAPEASPEESPKARQESPEAQEESPEAQEESPEAATTLAGATV